MIRHRYPEIKRRFSENQERLLLYGPPYTGKSFLLQSLTKEEGVKNYILCDLHIDRDFTDGLLKAISEGESLCHFAAGFFRLKEEYVRDRLFLFLDGLEPLGEAAETLLKGDLPRHFAATTSRIDYIDFLRDKCTDNVHTVKVRGFSFYEFLDAISETEDVSYTEILRAHYKNKKPIPDMLDEELRELFHDYLMTGGYPDTIMQYKNNRTGLSEIRRVQEAVYAASVMRYKTDPPKGISSVKLDQVLGYIADYAPDCRGAFHPGHLRRGATAREYISELQYLFDNLFLIPVYMGDTLYRFELSDCGLTRYLCNDYDSFYKTDNRDMLPEYFYQNYLYHVLTERGLRITVQKNGRSDYLCYTNGIFGLRHLGANRKRAEADFTADNTTHVLQKVMQLTNRKTDGKSSDHNIQYYFLEQTQF